MILKIFRQEDELSLCVSVTNCEMREGKKFSFDEALVFCAYAGFFFFGGESPSRNDASSLFTLT